MSNPFWSNVAIAVQSALASAVTISGITKASPGVVSYSGTDPSNGDMVLLTITGMGQLNDRIARVANVDGGANTFELEGIDTTLFDTFVSGSFEVITFGTTLSTIQEVTPSGGDAVYADQSVIHENQERRAPVAYSPLTFSMTSLFDASNAALVALKAAADSLSKRAVYFRFSNGQKMYFNAYVGFAFVPTGSRPNAVQTPLTLEAQGRPTVYAS